MPRFHGVTKAAAKGAAILAAATLILSGCAAGAQAGGDAEPVTLNWSFGLPTSWDPVTSSTGNDINILSLVYASITQLDEKGDVIPGLAESWKYNDKGDAVTFTLRPGLTFTDGTKLDAQAVKDSITRGQTQEDSLIKSQLAEIQDITVEDALNVTLHLSKVDYQLPYVLAGRNGEIVSPTAAAKDASALPTNPVGAGPFKFESFVPESEAVLVKNPDYWRADEIHIDRLDLTVAADPSTVVQAVQSGSIDVATLDPSQIDQAKAAGLTVEVIKSLTANALNINNTIAPFTDPAVIKAIRYGINRQELVDTLTYGTGSVSYQPFPEGYAAYNKDLENLYPYDPAKARKILADAGYKDGDLTFAITTFSFTEAYAQLLQAQLAKIGITTTIDIVPAGSSTWQQKVYLDGRSAQLATDGTVGRESPVANLEATIGPVGLMNASRSATPEFVAALDQVRATPIDDPDYDTVLQNAVKIGVLQEINIPTYTSARVLVHSSAVSELPHYLSQVRWEGVTVDRSGN